MTTESSLGDNGVISEEPRTYVAGVDATIPSTEGSRETWNGFGLTIEGGFTFPYPTETVEACQDEYDLLTEAVFVNVAEPTGFPEDPKILPLDPSYTMEQQTAIATANEEWASCLSSQGYIIEPLRLNLGAYGLAHEITAADSTLGANALKFTLDTSTSDAPDAVKGSAKVFLEYFGEITYNEPVSKLGSIKIDFKWDGVTGTTCGTTSCFNQIYVGVYTRSEAGDEVFYDCQLTFSVDPLGLPAVQNLDGGSLGARGDWHRLTILPGTVATNIRANSGADSNCSPNVNTLGGLGVASFVFGSGPNSGRYTFAINGGDTNPTGVNDDGLILFVDNIQVEYNSITEVIDFE